MWIYFREGNPVAAVVWIAAMMIFGFLPEVYIQPSTLAGAKGTGTGFSWVTGLRQSFKGG